mmetsp:Transcript_12200/g.23771  ORF Transcript_12200/g.23771 Transcript_12200/m.23771 type:complete len:302 (+) Transcript_12200:428-1333(+)|eukprot:CAMPEP_0171491006 /NCGR_PEP_ID=MMETSP0958-20121227/3622_1 /TAXON_ID=87120 /ORGANISM="Aurantiochytrium limacinum, Strain ATCCMYA-1381" /LENGTH=301 /DNA_ID=CAMNT_0012024381 /DNA_START=253 /DNA_END=1158 /DNA_ORIENTATION=+
MGKTPEVTWQSEAYRLVDKFITDPESDPFREPVLWKEWDLPDYPKIVKEPMDLGTIKQNLDQQKYADLDEFVRHMRLVWSNCMAYNADGSDLYKVALKLKRKFDRDMSRVHKKLDPNSEKVTSSAASVTSTSRTAKTGKTPSQKEVAEFCRLIYEIDEAQLGEFIVNIEETCESALRKRSSDDVDILVDRIDVANFRRLELMLRDFIESKSSTKTTDSDKVGTKRPASEDAGQLGTSLLGREASADGQPMKKLKSDTDAFATGDSSHQDATKNAVQNGTSKVLSAAAATMAADAANSSASK